MGASSIYTKIVRVRVGQTVVCSCGYLLNWVRAVINLPLVILSDIILSVSRILLLVAYFWEHRLTLDVAAIQEKRW